MLLCIRSAFALPEVFPAESGATAYVFHIVFLGFLVQSISPQSVYRRLKINALDKALKVKEHLILASKKRGLMGNKCSVWNRIRDNALIVSSEVPQEYEKRKLKVDSSKSPLAVKEPQKMKTRSDVFKEVKGISSSPQLLSAATSPSQKVTPSTSRIGSNSAPPPKRKRSKLKRQMKTHLGLRQFACDRCPFTFLDRKDLQRHALTHTDVKPYKCCLCGYRMRRRCNLVRHLKRKHEQPEEKAKELATEAALDYLRTVEVDGKNIPISRLAAAVTKTILQNSNLLQGDSRSKLGSTSGYKKLSASLVKKRIQDDARQEETSEMPEQDNNGDSTSSAEEDDDDENDCIIEAPSYSPLMPADGQHLFLNGEEEDVILELGSTPPSPQEHQVNYRNEYEEFISCPGSPSPTPSELGISVDDLRPPSFPDWDVHFIETCEENEEAVHQFWQQSDSQLTLENAEANFI